VAIICRLVHVLLTKIRLYLLWMLMMLVKGLVMISKPFRNFLVVAEILYNSLIWPNLKDWTFLSRNVTIVVICIMISEILLPLLSILSVISVKSCF
jgi:hypothetical protein